MFRDDVEFGRGDHGGRSIVFESTITM